MGRKQYDASFCFIPPCFLANEKPNGRTQTQQKDSDDYVQQKKRERAKDEVDNLNEKTAFSPSTQGRDHEGQQDREKRKAASVSPVPLAQQQSTIERQRLLIFTIRKGRAVHDLVGCFECFEN